MKTVMPTPLELSYDLTQLLQEMPLYEQACADGDAKACLFLAQCYQNGYICEVYRTYFVLSPAQQDALQQQWCRDAAVFYQKASALGDGEASLCLGALYDQGLGVPQDINYAATLYAKACCHWAAPANRGHLSRTPCNRAHEAAFS
jgi:TPR repeat protein